MQTKQAEYGVYRNSNKKMRQYLMPKPPPSMRDTFTDTRRKAVDSSLERDEMRMNVFKKEIKSSLAELIANTKRRVETERSSNAQKALSLSINVKNIKKSSFKLDMKTNERRNGRRSLIIKKSPQLDRRSSAAKNQLSTNRYQAILSSITQRKKQNQTLDFSIDKAPQRFIARFKPLRKQSEHLLNFQPKHCKHRSLHKMSVQLLGQSRQQLRLPQFISGFSRQRRLGKGGFSVVWEGRHIKSGRRYAIKQIDASNQYQTHLAEITFGSFFFENGLPKTEFVNHPGIDGLLTMHGYHLTQDKVYIVFQKCTGCLGEFLFDIYEETQPKPGKQEEGKSFVIMHKPLYAQLRRSGQFLKGMVQQLAESLDLLYRCNLIHSDVKTSNVLLNVSHNKQYSFKLIDYGSSFFFQNLQQYQLATPEYIPPQLLNFLNFRKNKPYDPDLIKYTHNYDNISAIDMWGLGCILLEVIHGVPLWLNTKVKVTVKGVQQLKCGLFATESRSYAEILERQLGVVRDLDGLLEGDNNTRVMLDRKLVRILKGALDVDPRVRMKPRQVLEVLREGELHIGDKGGVLAMLKGAELEVLNGGVA